MSDAPGGQAGPPGEGDAARDVSDRSAVEAALRAQKDLFANLVAVARATTAGATLEATLRNTFDVLRDLTRADGGTLLLFDSAGNVSTRLFGPVSPTVAAPEYTALVLRDGLAGWVARERLPALVSDTSEDDRFLILPSQQRRIGSAVSVPIGHGGRLVGVLTLVHGEARHFDHRHLELLLGAADQIALALLNAQHVETLQLVIRSSHDGVLFFDVDRRLAECNQTGLRMLDLGEAPDRVIGLELDELLARLSRAAREALTDALAATEGTRRGRFDGSRVSVSWTSNPVAASGPALGRLVVLHDLTHERQLERMREDLTHAMVHDLRGSLTVILSTLEIAHSMPATAPDMLGRARRAAAEMNALIDGILDIGRLEQGLFPIDRRELALDAVLARALELAAPVAQQRRHALALEAEPGLPAAWADAALVTRVLHNLVGNALKFTPDGGRIAIAARREAGTDFLRVEVSDDGPGLPESATRRLFERFAPGGQPGSGTGLGLAFCRLVVEAHDGRIWVEPGAPGTRVAFTLPTASSVADAVARAEG